MTAATAEATQNETEKEKKKQPRDPAREVVETVVFVVVLVLLLKLFITEAFVIPTGSMAETLYGYQKSITCPQCGLEFPVNSHDEVEGSPPPNNPAGPKEKKRVEKYVCPNCRYNGLIAELATWPENKSGDRVLVLKPLYHIRPPQRGDVVVFKFPEKPQESHVAANYIKRAMGFGGETVGIYRGDLFVTTALAYPETDPRFPRPADPNDLWRGHPDRGPDYRYRNTREAEELFAASRAAGFPKGVGFEIVRKTEDQLKAEMRIVWDNDKQPKDLAGVVPSRWYEPTPRTGRWNVDNETQPRAFGHTATGPEVDWIRYRHYSTQWESGKADAQPDKWDKVKQPWYVDNFLGYNASRGSTTAEQLWVGDLIVECEVELPAGSEVILELSKGLNRFQAKFGNSQVSLARIGPKGPEFGNPTRPCKVNGGTYKLRFANVDCRLWVWVDGKRIDFGTEGDYNPVEMKQSEYEQEDTYKEGWTRANDIDAPVSIGAKGPVPAIRAIKIHRDIYYTWGHGRGADTNYTMADLYYVQPGHYMCLGDNSAHSSDSREWGMVPERLLLGKAVFVFFPVGRVGLIK